VNFRSKLWLLIVAPLALLAAPLAAAMAQNLKPVAVVSVASINENLADVTYITRAAGMEDAGKSAAFFARALTQGIDKEKPIGMYVLPQAGDFHAVAFIPISDLKMLLEVGKEYVGTPKDVGNGILEIGTGKTAYLKEQSGFAFVAESKEHLTTLPADPVALLGDLPKKYNVAAKVLVQNIPEELRRMAIDQIKFGVERGLNAPRGGKVDKQGADQLLKMMVGNIERLVNETDELVIGLGINGDKKNVVLDVSVLAKEGTVLAKQMALQMNGKTDFAGFLLPDAAVTFGAVSKTSPEDLAQIGPAMKASKEMWSKQIDDSPDFPPEKRDGAKRVLGQVFDVLEKTAASGKGDVGGALLLMPKSISFAIGGYVADGPGMEKAFKDGLDLVKDRPDFPKIQLNAGSVGEMKFHRLTANIPDREPEARELLGEKLEILFAVGPKSVLVCGGKDAEGLLKKVLDRSSSAKGQDVPAGQLSVSLLPILKFYKSVDDNPIVGKLISTVEQMGNDKITLTSEAGPRDSRVHLELQEGLIRAIGEAAKAFGAGGL
jgi:hypothetical protein